MGVPVVLVRESLINAVVEVLVVREDDVTTNIVELRWKGYVSLDRQEMVSYGERTKPSGVVSVEARPPGVALESMIIHDGPSCIYQPQVHVNAFGTSYNLLETLGSTKTCWSSTNDENIDVASTILV